MLIMKYKAVLDGGIIADLGMIDLKLIERIAFFQLIAKGFGKIRHIIDFRRAFLSYPFFYLLNPVWFLSELSYEGDKFRRTYMSQIFHLCIVLGNKCKENSVKS